MSKNTNHIPFTEVVERVIELGRVREEVRGKVRGIVNDIYVRDIPQKEDWSFLIARSSLTTVVAYNSGGVTIQPGSSTLTFSSDVVTTSSMTGRKIHITGDDYVYDIVSQSGTTGLVIGPAFSGQETLTSASYDIFQTTYPLNSDFDRFPKNGGLHRFSGGSKQVIPEKGYDYYLSNFSSTPNDNAQFCIQFGIDTAGNQRLEISPPTKSQLSMEYDYIARLRPLRETTAGLIGSVSASGTSVVGDSNTRFTEATTGDWFRIDSFGKGANSEWYSILSIANNSTMTLATAFGLSGATSAGYTISSAMQYPPSIQPGVLYGSIAQVAADQDDPMAIAYNLKYAQVLSDGKRVFKSRHYQQDIATIAEDYRYRY